MTQRSGPNYKKREDGSTLLKRKIEFLENVCIKAASLSKKPDPCVRDYLRKYMSETNRPGLGILVKNDNSMACWNFAFHGNASIKGSHDPRVLVGKKNKSIRDICQHLQRIDIFKKNSILDNSSKGCLKLPSNFLRLVGFRMPSQNDKKSPKQENMPDHFAIATPKNCLIETAPNRMIMCTPPSHHMERENIVAEGLLNGNFEYLRVLTRSQLAIVDKLTFAALELNEHLNAEHPLVELLKTPLTSQPARIAEHKEPSNCRRSPRLR